MTLDEIRRALSRADTVMVTWDEIRAALIRADTVMVTWDDETKMLKLDPLQLLALLPLSSPWVTYGPGDADDWYDTIGRDR